ncbi:50S ribosome-binding GTPase [Candidatus Pacearchaeota archaeon]|nr:50S ribosome-binding GTPase [Candidatus Pacearchaeota archaeon]
MRTTGPADTHNRHKQAFSEQVREVIRISDILLLTLDARHITASRIFELEKEIKEHGKLLIHVLMKSDLVDAESVALSHELETLSHPILLSAKNRRGIGKLRERIHVLAKRFTEHPHVHVGVIGYPNTGKSSLIGMLARRAAAPVSSQPGFTKHMRKIRFAKGILLLDAPGVIPTKESLFGDRDLKKHALLGVHVPESVRNPDLLVAELMKNYPGRFERQYQVEADGDVELLLSTLGGRWKLLKKKGEIDTERVARRILKEHYSQR